MKWIGLTGGIATGKSTVAKILRDLGLPVVDADELARVVVRPGSLGLHHVVKKFGQGVLSPSGELDRVQLGELIFKDSSRRKDLEDILHPLIQEARAQERHKLEQQGVEMAFYDVPLLYEKKLESEFDDVVLVYAPEVLQRERLRQRENLTDKQISERLAAQMPIEEKLKKSKHVIFNTGSLAGLQVNVRSALELLTQTHTSK